MKLAYVDDDTDAQTIFVRKLSQNSFRCDTFGTGEELLKTIAPGKYDLLIIDIRLPGCNGVDLLKKIRGREIFTPAILITAFNSLEYAREALNSSANYLLEKPFSFAMLLQVAQKVATSPPSLQNCVDRGLTALNLTEREEEISRWLLKGLTNKEISDLAKISEQTVKQYIGQIFDKAQVHSRAEFFAYIFPI